MKNNYSDNQFLVFLATSCILHAVILFFSLYGIPFKRKAMPEEKIMTFELLPVSSVNNVKTKKVQKEPTIKNEDAKNIEKNKVAESTEKQDKPEEKKIEEPKKEVPQEEPKKDAEPLPTKDKKPEEKKVVEKKPEEKKKEEPKKEVKKEAKKEDKKPIPKKKAPTDKELDSLMKNLEKTSEGNNNKSNKVNREKSLADSDAFGNFDDSAPESLTNDELIKQQILKHWNQPIASASENITVTVELFLLQDGTVDKVNIISAKCPAAKDVLCSSTQDSVIRAITNASPLVNLSPGDYSSWKRIIINFNTKK